MALGEILTGIRIGIEAYRQRNQRNDQVIQAITDLQLAILETRQYIDNVGYQPNTELSRLWLNAFGSLQRAGIYADGERLFDKARFWGNPQEWLAVDGAMELIPTLRELENECSTILVRIK